MTFTIHVVGRKASIVGVENAQVEAARAHLTATFGRVRIWTHLRGKPWRGTDIYDLHCYPARARLSAFLAPAAPATGAKENP